MKHKLCLHGLGIKHQAQLLGAVKKLLPACNVKYKVKEEFFKNNDMYKYRMARFSPRGGADLRVSCCFGIMLVRDRLVPLADVIMEFSPADKGAVTMIGTLLRGLLGGKLQFIVDEPELTRRIDLLRGHYLLDQLEAYDSQRARTALYCHLPWQVYTINKTWQEVLEHPLEKSLVRQLRVRLRRLRSVFSLVKPLLPQEEAMEWLQLFKERTNLLGDAREYDVLLMACAKLNLRQEKGTGHGVPVLSKLLGDLRKQAAANSIKELRLNAITAELAGFLLWLYCAPLDKGLSKLTLEEFFSLRFDKWIHKLLSLPEQYPDGQDREQLHKIRIKLKRFRYALQSVPELSVEPQLLRSLKYLQDQLGLLHDDYINCRLLRQLLEEHQQLEELRYEGAMVSGWEQARAETALENLPEQWNNFCTLLIDWHQRIVKN